MRLTMYLLAVGTFLTGTAELVIAGIIDRIAGDLHISVALAGQLITAYSIAFAVGTPVVVSLTYRIKRKTLILVSLLTFVAGCFASYLSIYYYILMAARVVVGLSSGVFLVVAMSSLAKLVPAEQTGRAISLIALGFGSAMALGVPIGIAVSSWWGWSSVFILLAGASLIVLIALYRLLPDMEGDAPVSFRRQFAVLRNPVIGAGLLISFFFSMCNSVMLTYLTPFLQTVLHLNTSALGLMMLILGVTGIVGSRLGGAGVDHWGAMVMVAGTLFVSFIALTLLPWMVAVGYVGLAFITLWTLAMFMNGPALQVYFIQQAPQSSNLVLSLNTSVIHLGIAMGAGLGGAAVTSMHTVLYHPWLGAGLGMLSMLATWASLQLSKRSGSRWKEAESS